MTNGAINGVGGGNYFTQMEQMKNRKRSNAEGMTNKIFEGKDLDTDGMLSNDEVGISEERFNQVDKDGDGFISEEELQARIEEKIKSAKEMMSMLQENGLPDMKVMMQMMQGGQGLPGMGGQRMMPPLPKGVEGQPEILQILENDGDNIIEKMKEMMQSSGIVNGSTTDYLSMFTNSKSETTDSSLDALLEDDAD